MEHSVSEIEIRRLDYLEQQAALFGPKTDPAILIEIAELRHRRHGYGQKQNSGSFVNSLDFDLVRSSVAALLMRVTGIEENQAKDSNDRWLRQAIHDAWMVVITVMVFVLLVMSYLNR